MQQRQQFNQHGLTFNLYIQVMNHNREKNKTYFAMQSNITQFNKNLFSFAKLHQASGFDINLLFGILFNKINIYEWCLVARVCVARCHLYIYVYNLSKIIKYQFNFKQTIVMII